ncbi:hypothetical protein Nepgr_031389 [Nepenthes gracilis]|uniref:Uncharacterized protein n=1 Tax=Nepenthes gracilis TaxID=150966 RepID=A0AAD3TI07_NEPGR|nr:hypothetical protein Nepgr_031389 [Nepenthes gracilis]
MLALCVDLASESLLDKAPSPKVVRFAPKIMSYEAPSCASRCRKMAPCSDVCHPIVFRRSNLSLKDSMETPVDAVPKLASPLLLLLEVPTERLLLNPFPPMVLID